jgi:predicted nucleic acid-binding protein
MVALLDTSVVIDLDDEAVVLALPQVTAIGAVTLAELTVGPYLAKDPLERARRQFRLQQVESLYDPIAFDAAAARCYGQLVATVAASGRSVRSRMADLMVAATAMAQGYDLFTRNPDDFEGTEAYVTVITI